MKAIIFDLDDTLIEWKDEFSLSIKRSLLKTGFDLSDRVIHEIDMAINRQDKTSDKLRKKELLDYINSECNLNLPIDFINNLIEEQKSLFYEDKSVEETIKYLSKKYKLFVVTNWFTETQEGRLKGYKILKYITKVYGADTNYFKPNKKVYDDILKSFRPEKCVSIGDSLEKDILYPKELGMRVIWKTNKESSEFETIKEIKELMNIL